MAEFARKPIQKSLLIDLLMGSIFVVLLIVALWIVWVYYFRGPIPIVTNKPRPHVELNMLAKARKDYESHFHNIDTVVLSGIQTGSVCLTCHGDYPHEKNPKVRSMFNAHSWFIACEVCHAKFEDGEEIEYQWFDNESGTKLTKLHGKTGFHQAFIAPVSNGYLTSKHLDALKNEDFIKGFLNSGEPLNEDQKKIAMAEIHKSLTNKPVYCDRCHKNNGLLDFKKLLYSPQTAQHLESIDMAAMAETSKEFFFPDLFRK